jgi:hypothetical protein
MGDGGVTGLFCVTVEVQFVTVSNKIKMVRDLVIF